MKPRHVVFAPLLALGLVAACAQTTTTDDDDDADMASETGESAPPVDDATTDSTPSDTEPPDDTQPPDTEPPDDTAPPDTEPPAEDPPPPVPSPAAFEGVVTFYAGTGFEGQGWAPIGWWDGSSWQQSTFVDGVATLPPPPSLSTVSATSLDFGDGDGAVIDGLALGAETGYCRDDDVGPVIDIGREVPDTPASLGYDVLAAAVDWPLQPRPVRQVGLEAPIYSEVGAELFADVPGAATNGEVIQVVRVDLDGNGIEEVLVTYEHITSDFGAAGDFTGVYARYPAPDGTVVDEFIAAYVPEEPDGFPTFGRHTIAAVADLNRDGVMEVVVRDRFWEYDGMTVYALQDGRLVGVATGGCGV